MSETAEQPKRSRGRPRIAAAEKKRRNMTFRVRDELRDAVEELAKANGRSLSEQVEYYVEAGLRSEAALIYQYSTDAMSPVLFKAITSRERGAGGPGLDVSFPSEHREMLTIAGQTCLNQPVDQKSPARWPPDAGELQRLMCDAAREGAHQAIASYLLAAADAGEPSSMKRTGLLAETETGGDSASSTPQRPLSIEAMGAELSRLLGWPIPNTESTFRPVSPETFERIREIIGGLPEQSKTSAADMPVESEDRPGEDLSGAEKRRA